MALQLFKRLATSESREVYPSASQISHHVNVVRQTSGTKQDESSLSLETIFITVPNTISKQTASVRGRAYARNQLRVNQPVPRRSSAEESLSESLQSPLLEASFWKPGSDVLGHRELLPLLSRLRRSTQTAQDRGLCSLLAMAAHIAVCQEQAEKDYDSWLRFLPYIK